MTTTAKICEIFHSIQGEGVNAGVPAVFVRFFGCNLQCDWCDTKSSWDRENAQFEIMKCEKIVEKIRSFDCKHVVFTGGEPALFQDKIKCIVDCLNKNTTPTTSPYFFELETNGTIPIEGDFWDTINISPKLTHSKNKKHPIKATQSMEKTWWKFVVENENSLPEVLEMQKTLKIPSEKILLMPQAQNKESLEEKSPAIMDLCKKYGFRFGPRLHITFNVQ